MYCYLLFVFLIISIILFVLYLSIKYKKSKEINNYDYDYINNENIYIENDNLVIINEIENEKEDEIEIENVIEIENAKERIPKIIIQTWKTNIIPQRYMKLINSVKVKNPNYKYLFFTDKDIEEFLKSYYPEYYDTFLKLPKIIQKIDFFRYISVYHFGGFYLDLDMEVFSSFDNLLHNSCVFPIDEYISKKMCNLMRYNNYCQREQGFLLGQYAFGAEPKNSFIKLLIDTIDERIDYYINNFENNSEDYIYKTTGPDYVTDIYMEYENKNSITILDNGKRQHFGNYAKHKYFGTWK